MVDNTKYFRHCHCGKVLKLGGGYPLDDYSIEKYASGLVYSCENGHVQHVPRLMPDKPCLVCGATDWGFSMVGNNNSCHACKSCGFEVIQTGILHFYKFALDMSDKPCFLCGVPSVEIKQQKEWLYKTEKDESLELQMVGEWFNCLNCSASYHTYNCPYCSKPAISVAKERERGRYGKDYGSWQYRCKCMACENEFYMGGGWSD